MAASSPPPSDFDLPALLARSLERCLPRPGRYAVAVSGGSDSMALAALVATVSELAPGGSMIHVQHGLRGEAARRDAAFVAAYAQRLSMPCRILEAPPTANDPARTETAARRRRLDALDCHARASGLDAILLAHHGDDDLETLALRLVRGHVGDRARAGTPTARRLDATSSGTGPVLLRPFLMGPRPPGRAELARWRRSADVAHVEDQTNADQAVPRNHVRARLAVDPRLVEQLWAVRARARAAVQRRVAAAAQRLERHLHVEGLGARLDATAFAGDDQDAAELLRLFGLALDPPRWMDPRAAVVARVLTALGARAPAVVQLPAHPAPLEVVVGPRGLHLPDAAPAPGPPRRRVLAALCRSPLYL